jgi:hypothetical protein
MAIIKTLKVLGQKRPETLLENLIKKHAKINQDVKLDIPKFKKQITTRYRNYRTTSRHLIVHTTQLLEKFSKDPKLKNAEFVFLDRDALPYMYIAREICPEFGFTKEQFKPAKITNKAEQQIDDVLRYLNIPEDTIISIKSNGEEINKISKRLSNTQELKNLKTIISQEIDLTKPVVVIDSGIRGTAVKKYQILLKAINPEIQTFSSMFMTEFYSGLHTDYTIDKTKPINLQEVESTPKFTGKLLKTETQKHKIKIRRQNHSNPEKKYDGGFSDPVNAEIFMIALRNTLARYKKENGI